MNPPNRKPVTVWDNEPPKWSDTSPRMRQQIQLNVAADRLRRANARLQRVLDRLDARERRP